LIEPIKIGLTTGTGKNTRDFFGGAEDSPYGTDYLGRRLSHLDGGFTSSAHAVLIASRTALRARASNRMPVRMILSDLPLSPDRNYQDHALGQNWKKYQRLTA
jgi:hypothetical protein